MRKDGTKKGAVVGSGGQRRRGLEGRGATPKAVERPHHPAAKKAKVVAKVVENRKRVIAKKMEDGPEMVLGRNPVLECLRAKIPAIALYIQLGAEPDERVTEAIQIAGSRGLPIIEAQKPELDRQSQNGMHQGIALQVPPYKYAHPEDLLRKALESGEPPLIVALDNISDPRNLGAVIRSVAAFGGHGVVIPQRRSASVTAVAWRTSAGAAARLPVAKATNLTRTLQDFAEAGLQIVGLDAGGDMTLDEYDGTTGLVVVVGSEGKGLSRLVREQCDTVLGIPMAGPVESLNASVAAGVVMAEVARQRRLG